MKYLDNRQGLTLIEIIVSIAILGIIVLLFTVVLSSGYIGIIKSGDKAEASYESQKELSEKILQLNDFSGTKSLNLNFDGGPSLVLDVHIIESQQQVNGITSIMTSFRPVH